MKKTKSSKKIVLKITMSMTLASSIDPWNLAAYTKEAKTVHCLNGVHCPFWRDWTLPTGALVDPQHIFPIEILHHFHKRFWDHDMKWSI